MSEGNVVPFQFQMKLSSVYLLLFIHLSAEPFKHWLEDKIIVHLTKPVGLQNNAACL